MNWVIGIVPVWLVVYVLSIPPDFTKSGIEIGQVNELGIQNKLLPLPHIVSVFGLLH